jgi:hypothetical protein
MMHPEKLTCKKFLLVASMLILSSCGFSFSPSFFGCSSCEGDAAGDAEAHREKLRRHFTSGDTSVDVSTLIAETKQISARLKAAGNTAEANKFDSYTDVLMFGNRTVDESLNDVMMLVSGGHSTSGQTTNCSGSGAKKKLCSIITAPFRFR